MHTVKATIITIGDEILMGQTVDTNSAWMAMQLTEMGIHVYEILSIEDEEGHILDALARATGQSDIVLITGGLGPTNDDITKKTLAKFFEVKLEMRQEILDNITEIFQGRGRDLLERNRGQADVPVNCISVKNRMGTAPGMWFHENDTYYMSMPGVPREMKHLMTEFVIPKLKEELQLPIILYKHILTAGIPESLLAKQLAEFEAALPQDIKMAYLPSLARVKLRFTITGSDQDAMNRSLSEQIGKVRTIIPDGIYGYNSDTQEGNIGKLLLERGATMATAESCTGGTIAHRITQIPGSSNYFVGSVVSYSNAVKEHTLGVKAETLAAHGAVSEATVKEMVQGVIRQLDADYAISVSGIAGPGGGTDEKPVGTVWMAVGDRQRTVAKKFTFTNNRQANIEISTVVALELLRKFLSGLIG